MPSSRLSYHTHIKLLVKQGLLPSKLLAQIPRTNLHWWRKEVTDKYHSLNFPLTDTHQLVSRPFENLIAGRHEKKAKQEFSAYVHLGKFLTSIAHSIPAFHRKVKEDSKQVVALIQRVRNTIG
jgi:hypothetical protein